MSLEIMAGLAATRGSEESLCSWLDAGPLELTSWLQWRGDRPTDRLLRRYCPRCFVEDAGRRRWYSRRQWVDPRVVICREHGLPLMVCARDPCRLRAPQLSSALRQRAVSIVEWSRRWCRVSPCSPAGWLIRRENCLEDLILSALAGYGAELACSVEAYLTGHWRLHIEGWPIGHAPHANGTFQLRGLSCQGDRFTLVALVYQAWVCLAGLQRAEWPALRLETKNYDYLCRGVVHGWPALEDRLPLIAAPIH